MLSGTSYDAVDAAVAELSFETLGAEAHEGTGDRASEGAAAGVGIVLRPLGLHSEPYPRELRDRLAAALPPAGTTLEQVCRLDTALGQFFGEVAARADAALAGGRADLVVSHGQTVYHWVAGAEALGTLQLGGPAWIAEATGLPVLSDLRTRDIARGGQGAPLMAMLDALLLLGADGGAGRGALNLGGIANITVRGPGGAVTAYDLGPANALLDAVVTEASGGAERMDTDGAWARRGRVDRELLAVLLDEPYYRLSPPKSTGKELFHAGYLRDRLGASGRGAGGEAADLAATVTELTAELVAAACREHGLRELVVSGGGVRNPVLMGRIRALADPVRIRRPEDFGLPAQAKEGYLFALLGFLSVHGLPGVFPSATGARGAEGAVLGSLTPGARPLRLPEPQSTRPGRLRVVP
ncbi:anhydro-N-acetylmuramic acid kinase [Streptomyces hoynatensis]|nr:anhydro-N-acetylmuramic acid kinase [Streptomyces hoynatensis]